MKDGVHKRKRGLTAKRGASTKGEQRASFVARIRNLIGSLVSLWGKLLALPWLLFLKVGASVGFIGLLWVAQEGLWFHLDQPIRKVDIRGSFVHLHEEDLRVDMTRALGRGFFSLDIASVKSRIEQQPWVEQASIRRIWPDRLEIDVVEEVPIALWNDLHLLNPYGKVFSPATVSVVTKPLPKLMGPVGQENIVLNTYVHMRDVLAKSGIELIALSLEPRGAWTVGVAGNLSVMLGRQNVEERLSRFAKVYNGYLHANIDKVELIDARYTNGVSVAWRSDIAEKDKG